MNGEELVMMKDMVNHKMKNKSEELQENEPKNDEEKYQEDTPMPKAP
jgi:hypothetical protein